MIQIIGSVLLFGTCTALGFSAGFRLKERVKELRLLVAALEEMERELQCRLTPLPELLSTLSNHLDGPVGVFFRLCVSGLNGLGERSFSSLWREALEAAELRLEEEDKVLLEELGNSLGRYDGLRQCEAIAQVRGRLETNRTDAEERWERLGRVYRTLGVAGGAFLVIVLI